MAQETITLTLPEPPSVNKLYRRGAKGHAHESSESKAYKEAVSMLTSRYRTGPVVPFASGDLSLTVLWHRSRKSGDLDNRLKILGDALQGCLFRRDAQIARIIAERCDSHPELRQGFMRVTLERVGDTFERENPR